VNSFKCSYMVAYMGDDSAGLPFVITVDIEDKMLHYV